MGADDMNHMMYVDDVARRDCDALRYKESTYRGSWKKGGGRSAWFMLRRKIDRMLEMMKRPADVHGFSLEDLDDAVDAASRGTGEVTLDAAIVRYLRDSYVSENIFAKVREAPGGDDGSVLAEIRDLRRYLILVEAEMISRGVVDGSERGVTYERPAPAPERVVWHVGVGTHGGEGGGTVGGARMVPVETARDVRLIDRETWKKLPNKAAVVLYVERAPDLFVLEVGLTEPEWFQMELERQQTSGEASALLRRAMVCYHAVGKHHVLDVTGLSEEDRGVWPRLPRELNAKEHAERPGWQRELYDWIEGETKFRVRPGFAYWTE